MSKNNHRRTSNLESTTSNEIFGIFLSETHMQVANTATILNHKVGFLKTADGIIIFDIVYIFRSVRHLIPYGRIGGIPL
jgi:hypothetical protein